MQQVNMYTKIDVTVYLTNYHSANKAGLRLYFLVTLKKILYSSNIFIWRSI
jgi:uncharacterized ubiquitin-like protein YukD